MRSVIECDCGQKYVGSTICPLKKKRILEHIRAVKNKDTAYATAKHMMTCKNGNWLAMCYYGIDAIQLNERGGNRMKRLRQLESRYIIKLKTKTPGGMNYDELFVHLD